MSAEGSVEKVYHRRSKECAGAREDESAALAAAAAGDGPGVVAALERLATAGYLRRARVVVGTMLLAHMTVDGDDLEALRSVARLLRTPQDELTFDAVRAAAAAVAALPSATTVNDACRLLFGDTDTQKPWAEVMILLTTRVRAAVENTTPEAVVAALHALGLALAAARTRPTQARAIITLREVVDTTWRILRNAAPGAAPRLGSLEDIHDAQGRRCEQTLVRGLLVAVLDGATERQVAAAAAALAAAAAAEVKITPAKQRRICVANARLVAKLVVAGLPPSAVRTAPASATL